MPQKDYEVTIEYVAGFSDKKGDGKPMSERDGGFIIGWSANVGFGWLTIRQKDGKLEMHTECMSDGFVDQVFAALRKQVTRVG